MSFSAVILLKTHLRCQLYNDWIYLWWIAYASRPPMHGNIFIILKDSIQYIPIVGLCLKFAGFVYMSRKMETDQARLARRLAQLRRRSTNGKLHPMWLMMFPEGTNLSKNARAKSMRWAQKQGRPDMQYLLLPRSAGTFLCLKALDRTVEWIYDCTLAYDGIP